MVQLICQAFDSRQNSGGKSGAFYRDIVRCFDGIFAGVWSISRCEISIWSEFFPLRAVPYGICSI